MEIANKEYQEQEHEAVPVRYLLDNLQIENEVCVNLHIFLFENGVPSVATRPKADQPSIAGPQDAAERDRPTIQLDFFFAKKRENK